MEIIRIALHREREVEIARKTDRHAVAKHGLDAKAWSIEATRSDLTVGTPASGVRN